MLNRRNKFRQVAWGEYAKDGERYATRRLTQERMEALGFTHDPLPELEAAKLRQKARIAAARYKREMGGFTLPPEQGGMFVRTDARNRTLLNAAALRATSDPAYEVPNWKTADGAFITLTNSMVLALDQAVRDFIAVQFAQEASLSAQIDSATTPAEVNSIQWS